MAGFDFDEKYAEDAEQLLRALLGKMQRVCREYGLTLHFRRDSRSASYYVDVDGPLPMMQASAVTLAMTLPAFAEGSAFPQDRRRRLRVADHLARHYWRRVLRMGAMVHELTGKFGGVPNSFLFDTEGQSDALADRMWSLSSTLIAYENGMVGPPQIVEELHTSLEWLFRGAIGASRSKNMSYAAMVGHLRDAGVFDTPMAQNLLAMKDVRRDAKHRGRPAGRDAVNAVLGASVEACHLVLHHMSNELAD